jgi:hypothetical protein
LWADGRRLQLRNEAVYTSNYASVTGSFLWLLQQAAARFILVFQESVNITSVPIKQSP